MKTEDLIAALAADARRHPAPPAVSMLAATAAGAALTVAAFLVVIGQVRPDFAAALGDIRFLLKFAVTLSLAGAAYGLLRDSARPEGLPRRRLALLLLPALVTAAAVAFELASLPGAAIAGRLVGRNAFVCLVDVPLLGIGPLALFVLALRRAAPARPALAGAAAGLLAGAIAATAYAAYCPDDSPLFVATWYTLAISGLAALGAAAASRLARW